MNNTYTLKIMKTINKQSLRQITVVLLQFVFLCAYGQENFLPGYIIDLKGDTTKGFIDYRNWDKNPKDVVFRNDTDGIKSTYKPLDISEFRVLDELYESAIVEIETSPVLTAKLKPDPELYFAIDTTFLQTVIRGTKSLYYLKDRTGKSHFYTKDSLFRLLIYKRYFKVVEGKNGVAENRTFLGQLINYLEDCPDIQKRIKNTEYNRQSLENLFSDCYNIKNISVINGFEKTEINFQNKTEKVKLEVGLHAGMTSTSISFRSEKREYLSETEFKPSLNFTYGMYFDFILPRQQGRWSVCNELTFTNYLTTGEYLDFESDEKYTINYTTMGFSYLNLNSMIRFKYPVKKIRIFANAGLSNGVLLKETNIRKREIKYYTEELTEYSHAVKGVREMEQRFNLGLGAQLKKISFEFRYELGNGMAQAIQLTSTTKRFYFIFGYRF